MPRPPLTTPPPRPPPPVIVARGLAKRYGALTALEVHNATVTRVTQAIVLLELVPDLEAEIALPGRPELRQPFLLTLNVTNHARSAASNVQVSVAISPPYGAVYSVQGEERHTLRVDVAAGATHQRTILFTPRITGRWMVTVGGDVEGRDGPTQYSFLVPSPLHVRFPDVDTQRLGVHESRLLPLHMLAAHDLGAGELRLATGSLPGAGDERMGGPPRELQTIGGLAGTMLRMEGAPIPMPTLAGGESRWLNVTLSARGAGAFVTVPYLVVGDVAYLGDWSTNGTGPTPANLVGSYDLVVVVDGAKTPSFTLFALAIGIAALWIASQGLRRTRIR